MKKKQLLKIAIAAVVIIAIIFVATLVKSNLTDGAKFKKEYEKYNGVSSPSGKFYQNLSIDKDNKVKYATMEEALEVIKDGTGLIYFGYPNCPWCRGMVPTLLEVVDCSCLENLLYVDMTDLRDVYEVKDDEIVRTKEASDTYYELLTELEEYLDDYIITDEDGIEYNAEEKRIYLPLVVAVKNGEVVGAHTGTVELPLEQSPYDALTETQLSELSVIFSELIEEMTKEDNVCSDHC